MQLLIPPFHSFFSHSRMDMEALIHGLNSMITDCEDAVTVQLGFPIEIAMDLGRVVGIPLLQCSLLAICTPTDTELQLEPEDGVDGLLPYLHEKLKDDLKEGKIGRIIHVAKSYFGDGSSKNSSDEVSGPSDPPSIRSQASSLSSYYQSTYVELNRIGKGGYGRVFKCRHKLDGMTYAVKKIAFNEDNEDQVIQEVKIMAQLDNQNIVRYYQSWIEEGCELSSADDDSYDTESLNPATKTLYVAMEFCHGTLGDMIDKPLDSITISKYFTQMVQGLGYIHERGIVHRDLSKQNIMLDSNGVIKIVDFGFSILFDRTTSGSSTIRTSGPVGNVSYRAPEMMRSPTYINEKSDIFSLGLILFEMVHHMRTQTQRAMTFDDLRKGSFDWSTINLGFYEFIHQLLKDDQHERFSAKELLDYLWEK